MLEKSLDGGGSRRSAPVVYLIIRSAHDTDQVPCRVDWKQDAIIKITRKNSVKNKRQMVDGFDYYKILFDRESFGRRFWGQRGFLFFGYQPEKESMGGADNLFDPWKKNGGKKNEQSHRKIHTCLTAGSSSPSEIGERENRCHPSTRYRILLLVSRQTHRFTGGKEIVT